MNEENASELVDLIEDAIKELGITPNQKVETLLCALEEVAEGDGEE